MKFDLEAITLDAGWDNDWSGIASYCESLGVPFHLEKTNIAQVVFDIRKEKNPCSLCAKMRRGALHSIAKAHGCNKVALGHHLDDALETFLMSLTYEGRIHTFAPRAYLSRADITLIRPMIYVLESDIIDHFPQARIAHRHQQMSSRRPHQPPGYERFAKSFKQRQSLSSSEDAKRHDYRIVAKISR